MMDCFIHDLSLNGQYPSDADFLKHITELLCLRQQFPFVHENLYCSRTLGNARATATSTFANIAMNADRNLRQQILQWISSRGPFWDEHRTDQADDYFEVAGMDVTDQGAGEAARRRLIGMESSTLSFPGGGFDTTPITITHGLPQSPYRLLDLPNFWDFQQLKQGLLAAQAKPANWQDVMQQAKERYPDLVFAADILPRLQREPFSACVTERIFELLNTLQAFLTARLPDGNYTSRNNELIDQHFAGSKAWFTDESDSNKRDFKSTLTFKDPENPALSLFAPWHGKIKTPQFRIHFGPWPLAPTDKKLKVVYIGPKLTKG